MAANKFATMVHRNTNKITLILIYALLEWILILLLLLNSLFSYLIIKFAHYFGLKPPCLWCSRIDHFIDNPGSNMHRDLLCESHAKEISQLGYCSNHRKLAESQDMCEDCLSSQPDFRGFWKNFTVIPLMKQIGLVDGGGGDCVDAKEEVNSKCCSCCGLKKKSYPPYIVIKPSWGVWDYTQKRNLITETGNDDDDHIRKEDESDENRGENQFLSDENGSDKNGEIGMVSEENKDFVELNSSNLTEDPVSDDGMVRFYGKDEEIHETPPQHLEFFLDFSGHELIPIDMIDSVADENQCKEEEEKDEETEELTSVHEENIKDEPPKFAVLESMEIEETENSLVFHARSYESVRETDTQAHPVLMSEDDARISNHETESEVSIGTEIPDLETTDTMQAQEDLSVDLHSPHENETQDYTIELKTPSLEFDSNNNEIEIQNHFHTKQDSAAEDSLDGSMFNEIEGGVLTMEGLKTALRAERKALTALYTELEEERSASAVAATQTMAMINRLQEEKAAMQMEALQYQRMMEEQSEYDQEALQLLNELMVKREREKQEVERELEIYKRRVFDFEAKERARAMNRRQNGGFRGGFSSASCSNAEDSDGLSIDLNQEAKEENGSCDHHENGSQNTPVDAVMSLEESLADFEEERLLILEDLKVLEEKLFTLSSDEENDENHDMGVEENGKSNKLEENHDMGVQENGVSNGKHVQNRTLGSKAKRLLPLFDAISTENENRFSNGSENLNGFDFDLGNNRGAIEEEVDHLYGRLHALEADREFLKHCIGTLKKGDKGMDLLREILQHLRDLRSVELRVKNLDSMNT